MVPLGDHLDGAKHPAQARSGRTRVGRVYDGCGIQLHVAAAIGPETQRQGVRRVTTIDDQPSLGDLRAKIAEASSTGLSIWDTYQLVSQIATSRAANVVDPNYTMVAKVPKRYLPRDIPWMEGVHDRMRARGRAVMASRPGG